jgi:hypothetical protein
MCWECESSMRNCTQIWYIYIYIYIYTYIHTHIYTHAQSVHTYVYVYIHNTRIHTHSYTGYILFGDVEYLHMFQHAYAAVKTYIHRPPWYVDVHMATTNIVWPIFNRCVFVCVCACACASNSINCSHQQICVLACFLAGVIVTCWLEYFCEYVCMYVYVYINIYTYTNVYMCACMYLRTLVRHTECLFTGRGRISTSYTLCSQTYRCSDTRTYTRHVTLVSDGVLMRRSAWHHLVMLVSDGVLMRRSAWHHLVMLVSDGVLSAWHHLVFPNM